MSLTTTLIILIALTFFIYAGYPFLVLFFSAFKKSKEYGVDNLNNIDNLPTVSLIIACHNEEEIIAEKIENSLELNYPKEKIEIIVFSDGSTDKTAEIVKSYEDKGIKLIEFPSHPGKTICQNESVKEAGGEIIVFSDANSLYEKTAVKELVKPFSDEKVGTVVGALKYVQDLKEYNQENLYWLYESVLKTAESKLGMILGANGAIYALRKKQYQTLPAWVISDFIEPLKLNEKKLKTIYRPQAIAYEKAPLSSFNRKVRIILRSMSSLTQIKNLFNPFKHCAIFTSLLWHKLMRWLSPVWLISILIINITLVINYPSIEWVKSILILQAVFYTLAIFGKILKPFKPFTYFVTINLASLIALLLALTGSRQTTWKTRK
jgi:cellulose synthase/poly-beta-1,6-N-acetylglucosamine synthase-like glycosyltransferase